MKRMLKESRQSHPDMNADSATTKNAATTTILEATSPIDVSSPTISRATWAPHLLSYDELPAWYQDNIFIRHGYRPISNSVTKSFHSLFYIHNETVNIYTHLLPAVALVIGEAALLQHVHRTYTDVTAADDVVFSLFVFTAIVCLACSSCYHTLSNHSIAIDSLWLRIDFAGIIFLTLGDFVSGIYMTFWCERTERIIYWTMIATLGVLDMGVLLSPKFQGARWRKFRVLCFVSTGLSGFAPLIHGISIFGFSQMVKQSGMPYYLAEGGFLGLGALIYTTRFPECIALGKFDIYGASHQIFHVLVVLATATQLVGILDAYDYNYHHRICPSGH